MADSHGPVTSDVIARVADTNPVVMRRTMAGLRDAGLVTSDKGHGGGFRLAKSAHEVTLADIYIALDMASLFAIGVRNESPGCLVERAVNRTLSSALADAEALLLARLKNVTLADLAAEVGAKRRTKEHAHV
jgi:Rrf2 family protein